MNSIQTNKPNNPTMNPTTNPTLCPLCGIQNGIDQPSTCIVCHIRIELVRAEFKERYFGKIDWHNKLEKVHEELLPIILHPNRIEWFLPDRIN